MKDSLPGPLNLLASSAIFGSYGILIRFLGAELSPNNQVVFRYTIALVVFGLLLYISKTKIKWTKQSIPLLIMFGILMKLAISLFTRAALVMPIPSLLGYFYGGSIAMAGIMGAFFFREKITLVNWVGTLVAVAGLYILIGGGNSTDGVMWALIAGAVECLANAVRKYLKGVSTGAISLTAILGIVVLTIGEMIIRHEPMVLPSLPSTWVAGVGFGILATIVNVTVTYGFRKTPLNVGSIIMSMEIIFGAIFSMIFLASMPSSPEIWASLLILLSVVITNTRVNSKSRTWTQIRNILEA